MTSIKVKKIIKSKMVTQLSPRPLPKSLIQAAGLLSGKLKRMPLQYQRSMRKEWK